MVSNDTAQAEQLLDEGLSSAIVKRANGIYFDASASPLSCQAAVNQVFLGSAYFTGLDYAIFIRALYQCGPELPDAMKSASLLRFADGVEPFPAPRRELYKSVKIINGEAEYYFEPVFFEVEDMPPQPAKLKFDEFVADMWVKGIRFGIDAPAVKEAVASGRAMRIIVARRLPATPGRDAHIVEVSAELHRSNAPKELADGRYDWHTFQNRFPQVKPQVPLLRKVPRAAGLRGYELSGIVLEPPLPKDIELSSVAGPGTLIEHRADGEYLLSAVEGFVNIDSSKRLSIGPKIISREGVSARTTGNLQLTGEFEEFGEVQEQRVVEGGNITIHGDVFGNVSSRGGDIVLSSNLVGGTAVNVDGNISVKGVASGAVLQTKSGEVVVARAESCIISGTRVIIGEASNCEIMANEVIIKVAEGCAIAARKLEIGSAGPRKQNEMLLYPLVPDTSKYDKKIVELTTEVSHCEREVQRRKDEIDAITGQQEVRNYLTLATKVRKAEVVLTPEQETLFHKMAAQVGPSLRAVAKLSLNLKAAQAQLQHAQQQVQVVQRQKMAVVSGSRLSVAQLAGDTLVRTMSFNPDLGAPFDKPAKDIKARLRASSAGLNRVFFGSSGSVEWGADPD